ncbi:MAG: hypothetical protein IKU86_04235, partial [Thermoguttaceae bacterium]|nr:hypothetical protein [Thermoguttaceae bacterium]
MKSEFSEQELKERALDLLYGLLDEDEAEETRRLIASDATAARLFDEARETAELLKRAARWEEPETETDVPAAKNVAVETAAFDDGAAFFLRANAASLDLDASESSETPEENASSGSNRKRAKRRLNLSRKAKAAEKSEKPAKAGKAARVGAERDGASAWATVGRTA